MVAVALVRIRVPGAAAHPYDKCRANAVTFDGQRVIGVGDISLLHTFHIGAGVAGPSWRRGEAVDYGAAHLLPHEADSTRIGGYLPPWQRQSDLARERVLFPHAVAGGPHSADDVVGDALAPDVAKRSGEPSGDRAMAAIQEAP